MHRIHISTWFSALMVLFMFPPLGWSVTIYGPTDERVVHSGGTGSIMFVGRDSAAKKKARTIDPTPETKSASRKRSAEPTYSWKGFGYYSTLPSNCIRVIQFGEAIYQCGAKIYKPYYKGNQIVYKPQW